MIIPKLASPLLSLSSPSCFFNLYQFPLVFHTGDVTQIREREEKNKKSSDSSQRQRKDCGAIARETNINNPRQQKQQSKIIWGSCSAWAFTDMYAIKSGEGEEMRKDCKWHCMLFARVTKLKEREVRWLSEVWENEREKERESHPQTQMPAHQLRGGNITVNLMNSCYLIPTGIHTLCLSMARLLFLTRVACYLK